MAPLPTQKTVERLTRKIWKFSEEVRAHSLVADEVAGVIVAGVMSGTSADGINVALVRIQGRGFRSRLELLAHYQFPYPAEVRRAVLATMNAKSASVADLLAAELRCWANSTPTRFAPRNVGRDWSANWSAATARRSTTRGTRAVPRPPHRLHLANRRRRR